MQARAKWKVQVSTDPSLTSFLTHLRDQPFADLGQRSILSSERYVAIEKAVFNQINANDNFIVKTASTLEEASKLLEVGFEYVTEMEGRKLFRKRK